MVELDEGVYVEGQLDLDSSGLAREAWRSAKAARPTVEELRERCRAVGIDVPEQSTKAAKPAHTAAPAIKIASFEC